MKKKDPYLSYRKALTRYANLREDLIWESAYGIYHEEYKKRQREYEKGRVAVDRAVEKLIMLAYKGEL